MCFGGMKSIEIVHASHLAAVCESSSWKICGVRCLVSKCQHGQKLTCATKKTVLTVLLHYTISGLDCYSFTEHNEYLLLFFFFNLYLYPKFSFIHEKNNNIRGSVVSAFQKEKNK